MAEALSPAKGRVLEELAAALGPDGMRAPEPRDLDEPRGRYEGRAAAVLRPSDARQAAEVLRICNAARVGIVPRSGGTGLVGGQTAGSGPLPVVFSLERMNRIRETNPVDNVLVAEAGVVLSEVQAAAQAVNRMFPLSLASEGSACVGGLLATNAGGIGVIRYGNARDLCLGVEAVLADGTIVNALGRLVKDNMGYDLRNLLVGSEGTLGVITAAALRLHPTPGEVATAWISVESPDSALALLDALRTRLGGSLVAFELMSRVGISFLSETGFAIPVPPAPGAWVLLVEAADAAGGDLQARLEVSVMDLIETEQAIDALIAQNDSQRALFWSVRENIPEANRKIGAVASHDVSLPQSQIPAFIKTAGGLVSRFAPELRANCFGHLGDGNLHYNVFPPRGVSRSEYDGMRAAIIVAIHDLVHSLGGSVGAEHGVGRLKTADLVRYGDPGKVAVMRLIKNALDPVGILNPGAVLQRA